MFERKENPRLKSSIRPKNKKPKLIVILGTTASGKSKLALSLARKFKGEIISADSRQIYQGMDIGTDKVLGQKKKIEGEKVRVVSGIPHYLLDIIPPDKEFSVAEFQKKAISLIKKIWQRGKLPFLVGGTGLYIRSITENLKIPPVPPQKKLRERLEKKTRDELFQKLKKLDPQTAQKIDPFNKRRLIRALEVCLLTQKPFSLQRKRRESLFEILKIGLAFPKEELEKRIEKRIAQMFKRGFIREVRKLLKKGYSPSLPSFSGIGYKEVIEYLQKKISLREAKERIKKRTLDYAKRQMTWFKKEKNVFWIKIPKEADGLIMRFLNNSLKERKKELSL